MAKVQHPEPDIREIYASYYGRMLSWAARYFPEMADREDAVHEAFVRLLKRPELIRDAGSGTRLEGLLRIVLRSACLDLLKKQREVPLEMEELEKAAPAGRNSRKSASPQKTRLNGRSRSFRKSQGTC